MQSLGDRRNKQLPHLAGSQAHCVASHKGLTRSGGSSTIRGESRVRQKHINSIIVDSELLSSDLGGDANYTLSDLGSACPYGDTTILGQLDLSTCRIRNAATQAGILVC